MTRTPANAPFPAIGDAPVCAVDIVNILDFGRVGTCLMTPFGDDLAETHPFQKLAAGRSVDIRSRRD
jgi:hypothetical protein